LRAAVPLKPDLSSMPFQVIRMTRMMMASLADTSLLGSSRCIPDLIPGAIYAETKKQDSRQEFLSNFQATNTEREKNGLPPLDLCSEQYRFDRSWAREDKNCRERIKAYEAGDKTALAPPSGAIPVRSAEGDGDCRNLACDVR